MSKPATGLSGFFARVFSNNYRDTVTVRLGSALLLQRFGITGQLASAISLFVRGVIGLLIEEGVLKIDLTLDSWREGTRQKEFEKSAREAYDKATKGILDEKQKDEIRREYLAIIGKMGAVGSPKP